jgi:pantoate--beta-alanine ligase
VKVVATVEQLRDQVRRWRATGMSVALVPTMGNLHAGHLELVRLARQLADRCLVTIFVNPLQFGEGEDLASYPRTLETDREKLLSAETDMLFTPSVEEVYPNGQRAQTRVEVPELSDLLCGASRSGHFVGVATVVCKLFNMAQPDLAVFGEKDYQQLLVIRRMVADLALPVKIVGMATAREPDGLARSSRNSYLSKAEREIAPRLYQTLQNTAQAIAAGENDLDSLEASAQAMLRAAGFRLDYYSVRRVADLMPPEGGDQELVVLAAAWLGRPRLIDNLVVTRKPVD